MSDEDRKHYERRILMKLILQWGLTLKELADLFEIEESYIRRLLESELRKVKFQ